MPTSGGDATSEFLLALGATRREVTFEPRLSRRLAPRRGQQEHAEVPAADKSRPMQEHPSNTRTACGDTGWRMGAIARSVGSSNIAVRD
ncbi:MAG: hypothetical protein H0V33_09350 [Acidimicrobiia bacterium]|nr:hypothetical protein [Acidimicrobiia bacterium]